MRRAAVFLLALAVGAVAFIPAPVENLAGGFELRKRRDDAHQGREQDKAFAARKTLPESVSAPLKRPSAPNLRRTLIALALPVPFLALQSPGRGGDPTTPTYLQVFSPSNPQSLRAPPV